MHVNELFGVNAGKVWNAMNGQPEMTTKEIMKVTALKDTDVWAALGWLGREGKIEVVPKGKNILFKLRG